MKRWLRNVFGRREKLLLCLANTFLMLTGGVAIFAWLFHRISNFALLIYLAGVGFWASAMISTFVCVVFWYWLTHENGDGASLPSQKLLMKDAMSENRRLHQRKVADRRNREASKPLRRIRLCFVQSIVFRSRACTARVCF